MLNRQSQEYHKVLIFTLGYFLYTLSIMKSLMPTPKPINSSVNNDVILMLLKIDTTTIPSTN